MQGYTTDIINLIQDNLRDRYQSGFPILKELIQNADDAKNVSRLVFGDHPGYFEAFHPLLKGPGLFFFNNGDFSESDKRAIASFASNSKAGESETIGKFGLGMKSVFHLCEAFFYLAWDGENKYNAAINPWKVSDDDNVHSDWDLDIESDWLWLRKIAECVSNGEQKGFFLWIPLRKRNHLFNQNAPTGSIMDIFPGDDGQQGQELSFLFDFSLKSALLSLLPLLRNLKSIEFKPSNEEYKFNLELTASNETENDTHICRASGDVSGDDPSLMFYGIKQVSVSPIFSKIKENDKWPKSYYRDASGNKQLAKDKSKPEGSVIISHQDNQTGKLTIQWALFLPLEEESHIYRARILNSKKHIRIYIHGQFFVDAGRRGIHEFKQLSEKALDNSSEIDETSLRRHWNQMVAQQVTLPLLLETLNDYVHKFSFKDQEIVGLTQAIKDAVSETKETFLNSFRKHICGSYGWYRLIDGRKVEWRLLETGHKNLLPLPTPPNSDPGRPWRVFPSLCKLGDSYLFFDGGSPAIYSGYRQWSENELIYVVDNVDVKIFDEPPLLDYLHDFLENVAFYCHKTDIFQSSLCSLLSAGFKNTPLSTLRHNRQKIQKIIRFILPHSRLPLGPQDASARSTLPESLLTALWQCNSKIIIIPKDLDYIDDPGQAEPDKSDVREWLKAIHVLINSSEESFERCLDVANQLLLCLTDDYERKEILSSSPDLNIIQATDPKTLKSVAVSYSTLVKAFKRKNLFGFSQGTNPLQRSGLTQLLSRVIPEENIYLINIDTFKLVFNNAEILPSSGNGEAILASLGTGPKKIGVLSERLKLIELADNPGADRSARKGLRYLLHADQSHFDDELSSLWISQYQQSPAWEKLWKQVSGVGSESAWNVLENNLIINLPTSRWEALGIKVINPGDVLAELDKIGTGSVDASCFTDRECDEILLFVDDSALWKDLPLHKIDDENRCRIGTNTFLASGKNIPASLSSRIEIIEKSKNPKIAQKQDEWIDPLDETSIIHIALQDENPGQFWKLIMEMLDNSGGNIRESTLSKLRTTAWLPLHIFEYVKPVDVINIQTMSDDVRLLASKADYCYADLADLHKDILDSHALSYLKSICLPSDTESLKMLGSLMSVVSGYSVGDIEPIDEAQFEKLLPTLVKINALPAWKVVQSAATEFGISCCIEYLLPIISLPLDSVALVKILNSLSSLSVSRNRDGEAAFNMYLKLFCKDEANARQLVSKLKLKSRSGSWVLSNKLCHGAADVSQDFILDQNQAQILDLIIMDTSKFHAQNIESKKRLEFDNSEKQAHSEIKKYFKEWKGLVEDELIGAFICLLGPNLRSLANEFMDPHTSDWVYEQICWRDVDLVITDEFNNKTTIPKGRYKDIWERLRIAIRIVNEKSATVINLIGEKINVPLTEEFTTIVAGSLDRFAGFQFSIPLRNFTAGNHSPDVLIALLKHTANYILDKCYYQPNVDLEPLWQELEKSDQLQIDVARGMILDHLPFYLRQLKANKCESLRKALEEHDNARKEYQECKSSPKAKTDKLEKLSKNLDKSTKNIADILQNDADAKRTVLEGLKHKLMDYQYDSQSLPFELFQNSDDAAVELGLFEPDHQIPPSAQKLVVDIDGRTLRFIHWGRRINSSPDHSKKNGFDQDLEKMLILSASDKSAIEGVTGKFGLGFKSVFLCCDTPCLLSGRLRVQICGGVLPQPWVPSQATLSKLEHFTEKRQYSGTVVELQLNDDIDSADLLARFRQLASIQSVFGRAIKKIIISSDAGETSFLWDPSCKICDEVEVGACTLPVQHEGQVRNAITFRLKTGTVLFALSTDGFTSIHKTIPSIWVTAPTREIESHGFAVNSSFSLDAGRGKLAGDSQANIERAEKIGRELGISITTLIDTLTSNWDTDKDTLHIAKKISLPEFYSTIWKVLAVAADKHEGTRICSSLAVSAFKKMSQYSIPNGLPHPFERLIKVEDIQFELSGSWRQTNVIDKIMGISGVEPAQCIASEYALLLRQFDLGRKICKMGFPALLQKIGTLKCDEKNAIIFESIADIVWDAHTDEELKLTTDAFAQLIFKNAAGTWCNLRELLCFDIGDKEEKARFNFAPENARLSDSYGENGKSFFRRCRPFYNANADVLINWILDANTDVKRRAALNYLLTGVFGPDLCRNFRKRGVSDTWLSGLDHHSIYLNDWNEDDKEELLRRLVEHVHFNFTVPSVVSSQEITPTIDPDTALNAIYAWWHKNEPAQIRAYELEAFPGGRFPTLEHDFLKKEPEARKGWMTLFLLGAFHTIGWNTYEKNKRFVGMCFAKGWMDVFVSRNENSLDEWMGVIKDFISTKIEDAQYYQWMKEFISIFTIGYWLDDYVDSFLSINKMPSAFSLHQIVAPRINSSFQGGGPDAPPIHKALGMGACFVLRELVRKGVITNPKAHKLCYVPRKPVRELLSKLGCHEIEYANTPEMRSKEIHRFLSNHLGKERATFNNSFDLPLLMIAKSQALQAELLHTTILSEFEAEEDGDYAQ